MLCIWFTRMNYNIQLPRVKEIHAFTRSLRTHLQILANPKEIMVKLGDVYFNPSHSLWERRRILYLWPGNILCEAEFNSKHDRIYPASHPSSISMIQNTTTTNCFYLVQHEILIGTTGSINSRSWTHIPPFPVWDTETPNCKSTSFVKADSEHNHALLPRHSIDILRAAQWNSRPSKIPLHDSMKT